jgi:hypothetical protein
MPEIARFYGITIFMYFNDHAPPHLHARYGRTKAMVRLSDGAVLRGELPSTARKLVSEWVQAHQSELQENWRRAQAGELPERIVGPDGRD